MKSYGAQWVQQILKKKVSQKPGEFLAVCGTLQRNLLPWTFVVEKKKKPKTKQKQTCCTMLEKEMRKSDWKNSCRFVWCVLIPSLVIWGREVLVSELGRLHRKDNMLTWGVFTGLKIQSTVAVVTLQLAHAWTAHREIVTIELSAVEQRAVVTQ